MDGVAVKVSSIPSEVWGALSYLLGCLAILVLVVAYNLAMHWMPGVRQVQLEVEVTIEGNDNQGEEA